MASFWIAEASPYMDAALPTTPLADAMYHLLRPYIAQAYLPVYDAAYTRYRTQPQLVAQFDHT